ncbi:MAG: hypothetical protein Q9191_007777, partial [Dirinaria sp. TL-2023a]
MAQISADAIKRIAIIGAGPSGLATAKYLNAEGKFSEIIIYEQRSSVGGLWHYNPLVTQAQPYLNGDTKDAMNLITSEIPKLNTPMYEGLEANLPLNVMQFSDKQFLNSQLFPKRETVLEYIRDYSEGLGPMLKLEHHVLDVRQVVAPSDQEWEVSVRVKDGTIQKEKFDAVIVAINGHTDWPLLPNVAGLNDWSEAHPDSIFHSVTYKNADAFRDKRVLLVGGGPSGADISRQIGSVCKHPLLVSQREKSPYHTDEPYTRDYPGLVSLEATSRAARFEDGSTEHDIDAIMLCTGYTYLFPFLGSIAPKIEDEPLYQYIFHMAHPTLAFVEMPEKIVPFPLAECQAAIIARIWSGRLSLPPLQEMQDWAKQVVKDRGAGRPFYSLTPPIDLHYMNEMYDWCRRAIGRNGSTEEGGKLPKRWNAKEWWEREMAAEMKKAFNARGERRAEVHSYEELG